MNVTLDSIAKEIKQETFLDCVGKFIEEGEIKGSLDLRFQLVQVEDEELFFRIQDLAIEKRGFQARCGCYKVTNNVANIVTNNWTFVLKRERTI